MTTPTMTTELADTIVNRYLDAGRSTDALVESARRDAAACRALFAELGHDADYDSAWAYDYLAMRAAS